MKKYICAVLTVLLSLTTSVCSAKGEAMPFGTFFDMASAFENGCAIVCENQLYGMLSDSGRYIINPEYEYLSKPSCGKILAEKNGKYGYLNEDGSKLTDFVFDRAGDFYENLARVERDGLWSFINTDGNLLFEPLYDDAGDFSCGFAWVKGGDKFGYIGTDGILAAPLEYEACFSFCENKAVCIKDGNYLVIKTNGEIINMQKFDYLWDFSEGLCGARLGTLWGFTDETADMAIPFEYERTTEFSDGFAAVIKLGRYGIINRQGNMVVYPKYDYIGSCSEGFFAAERDGKWGYIDTEGNERVPFEYDGAAEFSDGLAAVKRGEMTGYINADADTVIDFDFIDGGRCSEGFIPVKCADGKWSYIQPPKPEAIEPSSENYLILQIGSTAMNIKGEDAAVPVAPRLSDGVAVLPIRAVAEAMGAMVTYSPVTKRIDITRNSDSVSMKIGEVVARVNGTVVPLSQPCKTVDGTTLVPLRFVAQSFGAKVTWFERSQKILIEF